MTERIRIGLDGCPCKLNRKSPTAQKGEVRNPKGENGSEKSREREAAFMRTLNLLGELEDEKLRQEALEALARQVIDRGLQGDSRVLCRLLDRLWPI